MTMPRGTPCPYGKRDAKKDQDSLFYLKGREMVSAALAIILENRMIKEMIS
jgi:hypothetical protein